jgi:tRNA(Ser,Leu) C12 N-acetylase TAN1
VDQILSYSCNQYYRAKSEILRLLKAFVDPDLWVGKTPVWGIAIAHTSLDNRDVINKCRALHDKDPTAIQSTIKWLPVDYWCHTELESIKQVIDEKVKDQILEMETWGMKVKKRRWQQYHTSEIVEYLTANIHRKVDLNNPDKLIWVDVVGWETDISLLGPDDIFTLGLSQL